MDIFQPRCIISLIIYSQQAFYFMLFLWATHFIVLDCHDCKHHFMFNYTLTIDKRQSVFFSGIGYIMHKLLINLYGIKSTILCSNILWCFITSFRDLRTNKITFCCNIYYLKKNSDRYFVVASNHIKSSDTNMPFVFSFCVYNIIILYQPAYYLKPVLIKEIQYN